MAAVKAFEEYECWKIARSLTNAVYDYTSEGKVIKDFAYIDQIRRACISVMNNIAEGHERGSNKDFVRFLYIARGSAGEVRNMLIIGNDQGYLARDKDDRLRDMAVQTSKACFGLIKYLNNNLSWKSGASVDM